MQPEILRAALDSIEDGVLVAGRDGNVLFTNARLSVLFGQPDSWSAVTIEQVVADLSPLIADPVSSVARFRYLRDNLDERGYDLVELRTGRLMERLAAPLRIEGRTEGKIWVYRDLVDRLQFETYDRDRAAATTDLAGLAVDVMREIVAGRLTWAAALFLSLLEHGEAALRALASQAGRYATVDLNDATEAWRQLSSALPSTAPACLRDTTLAARAEASLPMSALIPAALVGGLIPVEVMRARLNGPPRGDVGPAVADVFQLRGAGHSIVVCADGRLAWSPPSAPLQELVAHAREAALLARFALVFGRLAGFASVAGRVDTEAFRFEARSLGT